MLKVAFQKFTTKSKSRKPFAHGYGQCNAKPTTTHSIYAMNKRVFSGQGRKSRSIIGTSRSLR